VEVKSYLTNIRMRLIVVFLIFMSGIQEADSQSAVRADSIYALIKSQSIHRNTADWKAIDKGLNAKFLSASDGVDSIKSLIYVFEQLNDFHSSITFRNKQYGNYPSFDDSTLKHLVSLVMKSQEQNGIIKTAILLEKYGYIQVPGIKAQGNLIDVFAKVLSDSLCELASKGMEGYIIDLRLNGGGQLSSMVTGLSQLLGAGYLGSGVNLSGELTYKFEIIDDNFNINGNPMTKLLNDCYFFIEDKPVVLITGPATMSSGSILAIIFKQRPNTFFIGEPTAEGYSTGNDFFYFGPDLQMNLSTSFNQDRANILYKNSVNPDLLIKGKDDFENLEKDGKIIQALDWFKKQ